MTLCPHCGSQIHPIGVELGITEHIWCAENRERRLTRADGTVRPRRGRQVVIPVRTGPELRDEGMARVLDATAEDWKARAFRAVKELSQSGQPFTADDIRAAAGDPDRPNAMGAVLSSASRMGWIVRAGIAETTRPERHANPNTLWRGVWSADRLEQGTLA